MCRTDVGSLISRALFAVALLAYGIMLIITTSAGWNGVAKAQELLAVQPPSTACCKPGDTNCAAREYDGTRVALVVGVDDYGQAEPAQDRLTNLKNAKNDARELARILSDSYVVRCILDPNLDAFTKELKKLKDYLSPLQAEGQNDLEDNSVIVHFSGHGFQDNATDYILLSGNFATKAQALDAAMSIFRISDALESLTRFDIYLVFDSCRNRSDAVLARPDWIKGFGEPKTYAMHGHTIVFGAGTGQFAFDRQEAIGAKDNGALIFTLKKYFNFPAMRLREVYEISMDDPSMRQIGQRPAIQPAHLFSDAPWTTHQQKCSAPEKAVARQVIECRLFGGTTCIDKQVCKKQLSTFDQFISANGGPSSNCSRKKLFDTFSELADKCVAASTVVAESATETASAQDAVDQVHLNAMLSESANRIFNEKVLRDLFATAGTNSNKFAKANGREFLAAQRKILDDGDAFTAAATAKLKVKEGPVELWLQPSDKAGTTGRLQPTKRPIVDCDAHPCTQDWAFARVATAKGTFDGWLPASKIELAPYQTIVVQFSNDEFVASRESRKKVRDLNETIKAAATAEITTIIPAQATAPTRALALARLAYVQNLLAGTLKGQEISTRVLSTDSVAAIGQVNIQLFKP